LRNNGIAFFVAKGRIRKLGGVYMKVKWTQVSRQWNFKAVRNFMSVST